MKKQKLLLILLLLPVLMGFRTPMEQNAWQGVSNGTDAQRKIFVSYPVGTRSLVNDIKGSDPLNGQENLDVDTVTQTIFDDFNNVAASYVILAPISDSDYVAGTSPLITVEIGSAGGSSTGQARWESDGGKITTCTIALQEEVYDGAKDYVGVLTHEIGHCMGLLHPQETVQSVMSYFGDGDDIRLQIDDKMGMLFLYPINPGAVAEDSTLGLSCSKR